LCRLAGGRSSGATLALAVRTGRALLYYYDDIKKSG